jgi:hypothetical protein
LNSPQDYCLQHLLVVVLQHRASLDIAQLLVAVGVVAC